MTIAPQSLARQAGQLIFFGFDGYTVTPHARRAIRELHLGNVILFARNYRDPQQFFSLIRELQHEALLANGAPLFVAADQEGGSITRLTSGVTWFPGPMATRAAGGPALAGQVGEGIGAEMAALGLNFDLAPLVDLANDPDSAHVGSRSYGAHPTACAPYAAAFLRGAQRHVLACAKHFPSIGGSHVDLHLQLGRNDSPLPRLEACEMAPVRAAIQAGVAAVMTSHEVYPAVEDCPGTLSPILLTSWLRGRLGFDGLIVSDCMEMRALAQRVPTPEGCVRAVQAGADLLLVCHTEQTQAQAVQALTQAVLSGRLSSARFEDALTRIQRYKQTLALPAACPEPVTNPLFAQNQALARRICEGALTCQGQAEVFRCAPGEHFLLLAPPPAARTMADERQGPEGLAAWVAAAFPRARCIEYPLPLTPQALGRVRAALDEGGYTKVLVGTYDAHGDEGQRELLQIAFAQNAPVGAIALRSPFDARWYGPAAARLFASEYTPPMVAALVRLLQGESACTGTLPPDVAGLLQKNIKE